MKEYTTPELSVITTETDVITTSVGDTPTIEWGW